MVNQYKIHLDVCCLNRPFDDWQQERMRFEGEAVLAILKRVQAKEWQLISSEVIEAELERLPNPEKPESIQQLLSFATTTVILEQQIDQRSQNSKRHAQKVEHLEGHQVSPEIVTRLH